MSWIEGVGDEVTILAVVLLLLVIICVAWVSTGIRDIPFIRVIVVQLRQRRRHQDASLNENSDPLIARATDAADTESSVTQDVMGEENVNSEDNVVRSEQVVSEDSIEVADNHLESDVNSDQPQNEQSLNFENHAPVVDDVIVESDPSVDKENSENERIDIENTVESIPSNELRHRRLMFFSGSKTHSSQTDSELCLETPSLKQTQNYDSCSNKNTNLPDSMPNIEKLPHDSTDGNLQDCSSSNSEQVGSSNIHSTHVSSETETEHQTETGSGSEASAEIRVKLKYLNETQRLITTSPTETIGDFRQKHFSSELSQSKLVRFIFNGQDLRNDASTLQACNIMDNSVVHCLITQPPPQTQHNNNHDDNLFDIGIFMYPLFGILLGIVWYMRFMYRQFFNVTSTLTLCGISFLYVAAFMSTLRGRRPHEHLE